MPNAKPGAVSVAVMKPRLGQLMLMVLVAALMQQHATEQIKTGSSNYPNKPIRLIVPQAAGGNNDLVGRMIAGHLSQAWAATVVVDNRPGAGGNIGNDLAAKAAPDGYTLLHASPALVTAPALHSGLTYDPSKDFEPIGFTALVPQVMVVSTLVPAKSVKELIDLARSKPGTLNYGSVGIGSGPHVSAALFVRMANVDIVHVPYKGINLVLNDLLAGRLHIQFGGLPALIPHIRNGKIRALGISTARRSQALPEVPTIAESGLIGYDTAGWLGLVAPAGTARPIVNALGAELTAFAQKADTRKRFKDLGAESIETSPALFKAFIQREIPLWKKVLKASDRGTD